MKSLTRQLEELYLENISIWEEVREGDLAANEALEYMRVDPDSDLGEAVRHSLLTQESPL